MATANELIKSAFRIAGITTAGSSPTAEETKDALGSLNDLLESLSNESLFIYARTLESFPVSGGQTDYTIGVGGDFNTTRPTTIVSAYLRVGNIDYYIKPITDEDYAALPLKTVSSIPYFMNYRSSFPLGSIRLYPAPASGTLFLLTEKPLTTFTLNQEVSLPPGWNRYIKNQLALEICSEYGVAPPQTAVEIAFDAMAKIKRTTARVQSMDSIPQARTGNIYTGWEH